MTGSTRPQAPAGTTLRELRQELAASGPAAFLATHQAPALIAHRGLDTENAAFVTHWVDAAATEHDLAGGDRQVLFVEKKPGAPFPDRIGLGRAPNVDVVVRRAGISKYHAYFVPGDEAAYQLADAGSKNGTYIDDRKLLDREPATLRDGCVVRFGTLAFDFVTPATLLERLHALAD